MPAVQTSLRLAAFVDLAYLRLAYGSLLGNIFNPVERNLLKPRNAFKKRLPKQHHLCSGARNVATRLHRHASRRVRARQRRGPPRSSSQERWRRAP